MTQHIYLVALHSIGLTQRKLHIIFAKDQNYQNFFENISAKSLEDIGCSSKQIEIILSQRQKLVLSALKQKLDKRNVKIITIEDPKYPPALKHISNPPYFFYLRGNIDNTPKISVVGSRKISSYGISCIQRIIGDIAKYFVIVSGGAAGCDTQAHEVALTQNNKTLAIIGTGIDIDYPVGNKKLYDRIVSSGGGVISIFPIGEPGNPYNFPVRNEIVAGLSVGVIVVEASAKSGTLITASLALDMGKDLFAIPGDILKSNSVGCNMLIKNSSAKLVSSSEDVLEEYIDIHSRTHKKNDTQMIKFTDDLEKEIYNILLRESISIDDIAKKVGCDIATISFKLSMMEINQIIKKGGGGKYLLN